MLAGRFEICLRVSLSARTAALAFSWAVALICSGAMPALAEPEIAKIKLGSSGPLYLPFMQPKREDWLRLEVTDRAVKLLHTAQILDDFWGVYNWHDHRTTRVVFTPEGCPARTAEVRAKLDALQADFDAKRLDEQAVLAQRQQLLDGLIAAPESNCSAVGENILTVPTSADPHQGLWTISYVESNQEKTLNFKLPADVLTRLTAQEQKQ